MPRKNLKNGREALVYEFWAHDIATEIAKETLDGLRVPSRVETRRKLRDPSAPEGCKFDDWAEVYVDKEELAKWLERKIDEEINSY